MKMLCLNNLVLVSLSVAGGGICLATALTSCGGNGNSGASGEDGAADQTTDAVATDASGDAQQAADASADTMSDAIVVSDSPSGGGQGDGEAGCSIALPGQGDFVNAVATLACQRTQTCCLLSASQFNMAECVATNAKTSTGGWGGAAFAEPYLDAGRIGYDPIAACQCLEITANVSCGLVMAQTLSALRGECTKALPGLSPIDSGCGSSFECATSSAYCTGSDAGTCMPLVPEGGPCTTDDMCSYGALGSPSQYCDTTTSHDCVPRVPDDGGCQRSAMCASDLCLFANGVVSCQSSGVFSDPGVSGGLCDFFTIKDAGGGG
jgi:hypothetical protein